MPPAVDAMRAAVQRAAGTRPRSARRRRSLEKLQRHRRGPRGEHGSSVEAEVRALVASLREDEDGEEVQAIGVMISAIRGSGGDRAARAAVEGGAVEALLGVIRVRAGSRAAHHAMWSMLLLLQRCERAVVARLLEGGAVELLARYVEASDSYPATNSVALLSDAVRVAGRIAAEAALKTGFLLPRLVDSVTAADGSPARRGDALMLLGRMCGASKIVAGEVLKGVEAHMPKVVSTMLDIVARQRNSKYNDVRRGAAFTLSHLARYSQDVGLAAVEAGVVTTLMNPALIGHRDVWSRHVCVAAVARLLRFEATSDATRAAIQALPTGERILQEMTEDPVSSVRRKATQAWEQYEKKRGLTTHMHSDVSAAVETLASTPPAEVSPDAARAVGEVLTTHKSSARAAVDAGVVDTLVAVFRAQAHEVAGTTAMSSLSKTVQVAAEAAAPRLLELGALPLVVPLINSPDSSVAIDALQLLTDMERVQSAAVAEALLHTGAIIAHFTALVRDYRRRSLLRGRACGLLGNLSMASKEVAAEVVRAGVAEACLSILRFERDGRGSDLPRGAAFALVCLSRDHSELCCAAVEAGAVEELADVDCMLGGDVWQRNVCLVGLLRLLRCPATSTVTRAAIGTVAVELALHKLSTGPKRLSRDNARVLLDELDNVPRKVLISTWSQWRTLIRDGAAAATPKSGVLAVWAGVPRSCVAEVLLQLDSTAT